MGAMHNSANIATLEYIILGALGLSFLYLVVEPITNSSICDSSICETCSFDLAITDHFRHNEKQDDSSMMKKLYLVFIPAPILGHFVTAMEITKLLVDRVDYFF